MESTYFVLWKRAPSSASAAEDRTFFIIEDRTRMIPLMGEGKVGQGRDCYVIGCVAEEKKLQLVSAPWNTINTTRHYGRASSYFWNGN